MAKQSNPMPIQFTPFDQSHFSTPEGIRFVNLQMSEIVNAINRGSGQAGPVVIPAGLDVAGGKVSGLGSPTEPTDAVSLAHSDKNYGAPAVANQLDIGGSSTLKGLAALYNLIGQGASGTVTLAKLTGGGANGSLTVTNGVISKIVEPT